MAGFVYLSLQAVARAEPVTWIRADLAQFVRCGSRIGQAATQPLTDRQRDKRSRALTPQLRGALEFLRVVQKPRNPSCN